MKWFKHDADANADAKLQNVLLDYGLEGYGLYWYCIELIAGKVDVSNLNFQLEHDARIIARNTGSSAQKVEEMMKYFVKIGLFECSEGIITCLKMSKRLDLSMTSNPKMRGLISQMRDKNHDGVKMVADDVMQDKNRIDKNRKDNKLLSNNSTSEDVDCYAATDSKSDQKQRLSCEEVWQALRECVPDARGWNALTPKRRQLIQKFWREVRPIAKQFGDEQPFNMEALRQYLTYLHSSCRWMFETRSDKATGKTWQKRNYEYILSAEIYAQVREGERDDR